jgi:hexosaminidase
LQKISIQTAMKRTIIAIAALSMALAVAASDNLSALIPMPNHVELPQGRTWRISAERTAVVCPADSLHFVAETIAKIITHRTGLEIPVVASGQRGDVILTIDPTLEGCEHYHLEVSRRGIALSGSTTEALFRGAMTIDQLLLGDVVATRKGEMMPVVIDDAPRFGHRALMLDPARHFLPVEDVKFFIDQMAKYKYNVLQLHLTDDQGWRVAINSHPHLASRQHYTQDDLRDIIGYAAQRHIEIIPEMDIPGHTVAILAAYPELACSHLEADTVVVGHTTNRMVCAAK